MALKGLVLTVTVVAEQWLDKRVAMVFSRITNIILSSLPVWCVVNGLTTMCIAER